MTLTTVYVTSADGYLESYHATYATALAGANLSVKNTSTTTIRSGQRVVGGNFYLGEAFFNLPLTDEALIGQTVSDATLSAYLNSDGTGDFSTHIQEAYEYNWGGTLQTSHWRTPSQLAAMTLLASKTFTTGESAEYKAFTNNGSALVSAIQANLGSTLYIVVASDTIRNSNQPSNLDTVIWYPAEAGDGYRCKLAITHASGAVTVIMSDPFGMNGMWGV